MSHLRALMWLNFLIASLWALGSLFGLTFLVAGLFQWPDDHKGSALFLLIGAMAFGVCGIFSTVHAYGGLRVGVGRGRVAQTILAIFHMANVPLGTAYGIYALWVCYFNEETTRIFVERAGRRA